MVENEDNIFFYMGPTKISSKGQKMLIFMDLSKTQVLLYMFKSKIKKKVTLNK